MSFLQRVGVFFCVLWTVVAGFAGFYLKVLVIGDVIIIALFLAVDWILFPHHYRFDEPSPEEDPAPHTIDLN